MSKYTDLRDKHAKEFEDFPVFFAFSNKQFEEGMEKFGLDPKEDLNKLCKIVGGGFIKKEDSKALKEMFDRHSEEMDKAVKSDINGTGFVYEMFRYELDNHEYGYTGDPTDTLETLSLDLNDIANTPNLLKGFKLAGGVI